MRIRITAGGIHGADGKEIEIGSEHDVQGEPVGWDGRYVVLSGGDTAGKTAVTNPADAGPTGPFEVRDDGNGWHGIYGADGEKVKSVRKDDAEAFAGLSPEDQAAYLTEA